MLRDGELLSVINFEKYQKKTDLLIDSDGWIDICPGVGLQGHMAALVLVSLRALHTVLHGSFANTTGGFPPIVQEDSLLSTLQHLLFVDCVCVCGFFDDTILPSVR